MNWPAAGVRPPTARWPTRPAAVLSGLALLLSIACSGDRPRPDPMAPGGMPRLEVSIETPAQNQTVIAGRSIPVIVDARDEGGARLTGIGYVARRSQGAERIDSVTRFFTPRASAQGTFQLVIPDYPTDTQLQIIGLAFGTEGHSRMSAPRGVIVVECRPEWPQCQ